MHLVKQLASNAQTLKFFVVYEDFFYNQISSYTVNITYVLAIVHICMP